MAQPYVLEWLASPLNSNPEITFDLPYTKENVANQSAMPLACYECYATGLVHIGDTALLGRCNYIFPKKCAATHYFFV